MALKKDQKTHKGGTWTWAVAVKLSNDTEPKGDFALTPHARHAFLAEHAPPDSMRYHIRQCYLHYEQALVFPATVCLSMSPVTTSVRSIQKINIADRECV